MSLRRRLVALLASLALLGTVPLVAEAQTASAPPIAAIAATTTGAGYWLAGRDGSVVGFGDARVVGSLAGRRLAAPIVGMAVDPDGSGYWLAAADGGVFAFDAPFLGSMGGRRLNRPIVGTAADPDGRGYWLVASDGGIFSFAATFAGSLGSTPLNSPIVAVAADPDRQGYWLVAGDGGVFSFQARFLGSTGGRRLGGAVVGIAPTRTGAGYWTAGTDGTVFPFGDAGMLGSGGRPVLEVTTVTGGLANPWDVGFGPGGELFFTERSGRFSVRVGTENRLLGAPRDVFASGEGGMLGLTVDPSFAESRRVYICQSWTDGSRRDVRVYAWAVAEDLRSATRLEPPLVSGMPAGSGRHNGCRPRIGPDGFLYIGTGDAAIGTNPQDLGSLGGKVLRVDRVFGAPAAGNPFSGSRVFTYGHRNVQGIAFRPGQTSGAVFSAEHGPDRDDEINRLRPGANAGWDPAPGYDESVPMTDTRRFPGALEAAWRSGPTTLAPSGMDFLSGPGWRSWNGALAVAMLKGSQLRIFFLDGAGRVVDEEVVLTDRGRLRSAVLGPDGSLYVTTANGTGDRILRVTPG